MKIRPRLVAAPLTVVLIVAACTSGPGAGPPATLVGRAFLSTAVTVNGTPRPLVDGTRIRLSFTATEIGASAGCNSLGARYTLAAGQLLIEELAMTEMGCDAPRHEQDEWLAAFLASKPALRLSADDLTLEAGGTVVTLVDRRIAEPDASLVGTRWSLESIAQGDTVSGVPATVAVPTLDFAADGPVRLTTGCNEGSATYALDGTRIRLSDIGTTKRACPGDGGDLESVVLAILGADDLTVRIDGSLLKLESGRGRLEYRSGSETP